MKLIGTIRTRYQSTSDTPVQSKLNPDEYATIELDEIYAEGLLGIEGFDHLWLLTWLDGEPTDQDVPMRQIPYLLQRRGQQVGVFAMRGPHRPNPIGLSLVRLVEVRGSALIVAGVDMLDGTKVLDIKPYVAPFDAPAEPGRHGWFDEVVLPLGATPSTLRPEADR